MNTIRILGRTDETVTLRASDFDALIGAAEDAEDLATLLSAGAREEALGRIAARSDHLSDDRVGRLLAGENPVAIWREHRGLSVEALAAEAGLSRRYLAELESGRKPGSLGTLQRLAAALDVSVDDLLTA